MKRLFRYVLTALLLLTGTLAGAAGKQFTLVIDAGHGGKDAGALGKYSKEKTINLNVALAFGRYVKQNCPDVRVIYTRTTDVFVPLHERAAIANRNKADVFISIHTNSVASKRPVTGLETYTMGMRRSDEKLSAAMRENDVVLIEDNFQQHYAGFDPRSPESYIIFEMINDANMLQSVELAKAIQRNVCRTASRPNKGVKQDAFLVLRETSMPACLIELGYITTPSEEAVLNNKKNIDAIARGICEAFVEYKAKQTGTVPRTVKAPDPEPAVEAEKAEPAEKTQPTEKAEPAEKTEAPQAAASADRPVFKVQFLTSDRQLKAGDRLFKGLKDVGSYKEGRIWKYTVGSTTDYNAARALRKEVAQKFPQAFIIAFLGPDKIDRDEAVSLWRGN